MSRRTLPGGDFVYPIEGPPPSYDLATPQELEVKTANAIEASRELAEDIKATAVPDEEYKTWDLAQLEAAAAEYQRRLALQKAGTGGSTSKSSTPKPEFSAAGSSASSSQKYAPPPGPPPSHAFRYNYGPEKTSSTQPTLSDASSPQRAQWVTPQDSKSGDDQWSSINPQQMRGYANEKSIVPWSTQPGDEMIAVPLPRLGTVTPPPRFVHRQNTLSYRPLAVPPPPPPPVSITIPRSRQDSQQNSYDQSRSPPPFSPSSSHSTPRATPQPLDNEIILQPQPPRWQPESPSSAPANMNSIPRSWSPPSFNLNTQRHSEIPLSGSPISISDTQDSPSSHRHSEIPSSAAPNYSQTDLAPSPRPPASRLTPIAHRHSEIPLPVSTPPPVNNNLRHSEIPSSTAGDPPVFPRNETTQPTLEKPGIYPFPINISGKNNPSRPKTLYASASAKLSTPTLQFDLKKVYSANSAINSVDNQPQTPVSFYSSSVSSVMSKTPNPPPRQAAPKRPGTTETQYSPQSYQLPNSFQYSASAAPAYGVQATQTQQYALPVTQGFYSLPSQMYSGQYQAQPPPPQGFPPTSVYQPTPENWGPSRP